MGHRHVFLVSLALLLVATTHAGVHYATTQAADAAAITQQGTDNGAGVVVGSMTTGRSMIGSTPPSCEGMCGWWCVGRSCEAVLVPIEPPQEQDDNKQSRRHGSGGGGGGGGSRASAAAQQRRLSPYDDGDYTNYKPVAWRCKCVG